MKTLIVRVDDLEGTGPQRGYPVALFYDDGEPGWEHRAIARTVVPESLSPPTPPLNPPTGEPMSEDDIRHLVLREPSSPRFAQVGRYLHDLVVRGDVATEWQRLRALYPVEQPPQEGIRAVLDVRPQRLRRLPWELISRGDVGLSIQAGNGFVRGAGIDLAARNPGQLVPLRLLVVVGCPQDDRVQAAAEVEAIRAAIPKFRGRVDPEFLEGPSRRKLVDTCQAMRPDIFHFIGHGEGSEDDAVLKLCDPTGQEWSLSRTDILNDLSGWTGRLAILNACRTSDPGEQSAILSLADAFTEQGWPAVIGMQGDILSSAAVAFAGSLYSSLAEGKPLDLALVDARRYVYTRDGSSNRTQRDWFLPAVTLTVPPDEVLRMRFGAPDRVTEVEEAPDFKMVRTFVDRHELRRDISRDIDPEEPFQPVNLLLVCGTEDIGKSWLVRWCLRTCALRGRSVRYVNLGGSNANFLEVLRRIRDASTFACNAKVDAAFAPFNDDLNAWLRPPGDSTDLVDGSDAGFPLRAGPEDLIERIFTSFRSALREAARDAPVVLALDQLDKVIEEDFLNYVWPYLIQRVAQGQVGQVRMIVVTREQEMNALLPPHVADAYKTVRVTLIDKEEFVPAASEFFLHRGLTPEEFQPMVESTYKHWVKGEWSPIFLRRMVEDLRSLGWSI